MINSWSNSNIECILILNIDSTSSIYKFLCILSIYELKQAILYTAVNSHNSRFIKIQYLAIIYCIRVF